MTGAFDKEIISYADGMGVALYQRFSLHEASLFLRIQQSELEKLIKQHRISYIQVTKTEIQFFGFQLIEYLINQTQTKQNTKTKQSQTTLEPNTSPNNDRILRFPEVKEMVGLSRTTIWRKEQTGDFPRRVPLGVGSVGWFKSEVEAWLNEKR